MRCQVQLGSRARQTPDTLGRALGLLGSAFALVNERNGEAGVLSRRS
jgi:hypothetical protein